MHGRNARISNSGSTAARQNALSEFNEAIVMSNRALRDGELFEIQVCFALENKKNIELDSISLPMLIIKMAGLGKLRFQMNIHL